MITPRRVKELRAMLIRPRSWGYALIFACSVTAAQEDFPGTAVEDDAFPRRSVDRPPQAVNAEDAAPSPAGITNDDIVDMVGAEFSDATIAAAIGANPTRFDISPRALLALKSAGVSERVIDTMLAAEAANKQSSAAQQAAAPAPEGAGIEISADAAAPLPEMSPEALAMLSQMVERLAAQSAAPHLPAAVEGDTQPPHAEHGPHAWAVVDGDEFMLTPTVAQVAFTDAKITDTSAFNTLQGLAGKALAFVNPALGLAGEMAGLFRPGDPTMTAVWALLGASASREFDAETLFTIEFADIPGVDPDQYEPAIVRLVPTSDNYRVVGAAKTKASKSGAPTGPIIEETAASESERLARGRYRVGLREPVAAGEYALVLRPIPKKGRKRERDVSLSELLGAGSTEVLYTTWDFEIAR
jgi:hypothetical protein